MKMKIKNLNILIIIVISSLLVACSNSQSSSVTAKKKQKTLTIKESKQETSLFFNGLISPITTHSITSPIDGNVTKVGFVYGDLVKKGELLLELKSSTLDKSYQTAISGYLTAKEKYNTSKNNIVGAKNLYDSGITSRQTYDSAVSTLNDNYLSFLQAQHTLLTLFRKARIDEGKIELLKIGNEKAVRKALEAPLKNIQIKAETDGIALLPTKAAADSASGNNKSIHVGSEVKSGQLLLAIGQMSGIKIRVKVGEININEIHSGDKATVNSAAFPGITLHGEVSAVSRQANANEGGGLPNFPVSVSIKNITKDQQKLIHVGMSAKVKITIAAPEEITIPINAVKILNNLPYVMLVDPKTGKAKRHPVQTGATTLSGVNIVKGLKPGDKIVFSD